MLSIGPCRTEQIGRSTSTYINKSLLHVHQSCINRCNINSVQTAVTGILFKQLSQQSCQPLSQQSTQTVVTTITILPKRHSNPVQNIVSILPIHCHNNPPILLSQKSSNDVVTTILPKPLSQQSCPNRCQNYPANRRHSNPAKPLFGNPAQTDVRAIMQTVVTAILPKLWSELSCRTVVVAILPKLLSELSCRTVVTAILPIRCHSNHANQQSQQIVRAILPNRFYSNPAQTVVRAIPANHCYNNPAQTVVRAIQPNRCNSSSPISLSQQFSDTFVTTILPIRYHSNLPNRSHSDPAKPLLQQSCPHRCHSCPAMETLRV